MVPEFEWSDEKRLIVLAARQLDFIDGRALFDGRPIDTVLSSRAGEERWVSVGYLQAQLAAVVWTKRGEKIRIITMRGARDEEKRRYRLLYG